MLNSEWISQKYLQPMGMTYWVLIVHYHFPYISSKVGDQG